MNKDYWIALAIGIVVIALTIVGVGVEEWPHPLRFPEFSNFGWIFYAFILIPLAAMPLSLFPNYAMPVVLLVSAGVITLAIVEFKPDGSRALLCVGIFLAMCVIVEPRILWSISRLIQWKKRKPIQPPPQDPPTEFSPALVPRTPKGPGPLVAHAIASCDD